MYTRLPIKTSQLQNGPMLAVVKPGSLGVGWVIGFEPWLRTGQMGWSGRFADVVNTYWAAALDAKLS